PCVWASYAFGPRMRLGLVCVWAPYAVGRPYAFGPRMHFSPDMRLAAVLRFGKRQTFCVRLSRFEVLSMRSPFWLPRSEFRPCTPHVHSVPRYAPLPSHVPDAQRRASLPLQSLLP